MKWLLNKLTIVTVEEFKYGIVSMECTQFKKFREEDNDLLQLLWAICNWASIEQLNDSVLFTFKNTTPEEIKSQIKATEFTVEEID